MFHRPVKTNCKWIDNSTPNVWLTDWKTWKYKRLIFSLKNQFYNQNIYFLSRGGGGWGGRNTMHSTPIKKEAIQNFKKKRVKMKNTKFIFLSRELICSSRENWNVCLNNWYVRRENWYVHREKIDMFVNKIKIINHNQN